VAAIYPERLGRYRAKYGLEARTLAQIAVKNRGHAALNPRAQYTAPISVDDVLASRLVAEPLTALTTRAEEIHRARSAVRRDITRLVATETERVGHLAARLATLGPAATLARGYAVVQTVTADLTAQPQIMRSVDEAPAGTRLRVRVADGSVAAISEGRTDGV